MKVGRHRALNRSFPVIDLIGRDPSRNYADDDDVATEVATAEACPTPPRMGARNPRRRTLMMSILMRL